MNRATVFVTIIVLVLSSMAFAQPSPSVVADQVPNSQPTYYGHERNVARTSDGTLLVAWQDNRTDGQVVYSVYDDAFSIWNPAVPISSAETEAHKVGLVADNQGGVHAAWQQQDVSPGTWQIYYSKYTGGSFSTPVKVSTNDLFDNEECAIEIDSNGRIFVVWNTDAEADGDEWILCSISDDGTTWPVPDTLSSSDGIIDGTSPTSGRVALYPGSAGKMAATWHEDYPGREREIRVNQYDGSNWQGEVVISDTTASVSRHWYPTITVDSQDNIYVVYADDQSGSNPRHILLGKKAWATPDWPTERDTLAMTTDGDYLTITSVIDPNDDLHVAHRRPMEGDTLGLEEISYITSQDGGSTWSVPLIVSRPNHDAAYPTFAARVFGDKVELSWRETAAENSDDGSPTAVVYGFVGISTAIENNAGFVSEKFQLHQNYPNPFNPETQIRYQIARKGQYELAVYNLLGEMVKTLLSDELIHGEYQVSWDGTNQSGDLVASGIYFYQLKGDDLSITRKMMFIR